MNFSNNIRYHKSKKRYHKVDAVRYHKFNFVINSHKSLICHKLFGIVKGTDETRKTSTVYFYIIVSLIENVDTRSKCLCAYYYSKCNNYTTIILRFVRLFEEIIHELSRVDYLPYRRTKCSTCITILIPPSSV